MSGIIICRIIPLDRGLGRGNRTHRLRSRFRCHRLGITDIRYMDMLRCARENRAFPFVCRAERDDIFGQGSCILVLTDIRRCAVIVGITVSLGEVVLEERRSVDILGPVVRVAFHIPVFLVILGRSPMPRMDHLTGSTPLR